MKTSNLLRRTLFVLGTLTVLACLALVGTGYYLLDYGLAPDPNRRDKDSAYTDLYTRYPDMEAWVKHHQLQRLSLKNNKGQHLHADYIKADSATGRTAIVVHGYRDCNVKFLYLARMYGEMGFNVLFPDLVAHGQSQGEAIQMGWNDAEDLLAWCGAAYRLFSTKEEQASIVVHGVSMGAATVMNFSGRDVPPYVRAAVADCGFTSVWDEFSAQLHAQFGLPEFPLLSVASMLCEWHYGWNFHEASPLESVRKSLLPTLFIHGTNDDYVPTHMVHELYAAKAGEKQLWLAPDAGHAESFKLHPEEYARRVSTFCNAALQE